MNFQINFGIWSLEVYSLVILRFGTLEFWSLKMEFGVQTSEWIFGFSKLILPALPLTPCIQSNRHSYHFVTLEAYISPCKASKEN